MAEMITVAQAQARALRTFWQRRDGIEREAAVAGIARRTEDAHSHDRYGPTSWRMCVRFLLIRGLDGDQAEAFLRSKHMRWAADEHGSASGRALRKYVIERDHLRGPGWLEVEARELAGETWH